jgi:hypothetical protein
MVSGEVSLPAGSMVATSIKTSWRLPPLSTRCKLDKAGLFGGQRF